MIWSCTFMWLVSYKVCLLHDAYCMSKQYELVLYWCIIEHMCKYMC